MIEVAGSAPAGRVAELLGLEISTLSRNARIMEGEGWVSVDPAGRGNGRILALTEAGRQKLRESKPAWDEAQAQARALLGPDGSRDLKRIGDATWGAACASLACWLEIAAASASDEAMAERIAKGRIASRCRPASGLWLRPPQW